MAQQHHREPIESGCPDGFQYMHPVMRKNFGNWKYHEHPRPGVLRHIAYDIGDTYADGYVRFTIRSNIEYMVADASKVEPMIQALEKEGFVVGGTKNSV